MCVCLSVCICTTCIRFLEVRRGFSSLDLESWVVVSCLPWAQQAEPGSSARTVSAVNCCAISPGLNTECHSGVDI